MDERRVLIFPPSRRDGAVTQDLLTRGGVACAVCYSASELSDEISRGVGALVLTDSALGATSFDQVIESLARQPPWSDLPVVLLCQIAALAPVAVRRVQLLTNVTILDRPTSARTLVSAVHTAIRGRLRQYQTREQLEALRTADERLRIADRRKDEFLAMLAHELRNPLAPIHNASALLSRMADPQMQRVVGIVKRQVVHLSRLVDDLLDVSRITQGRIELQRQPVDLATIIALAMESVEPLMQERRHRVFVSAGFDTLFVDGDSARLVQCIANILTNSAKYTDEAGEIRVELRHERDAAVISVTDNGVGIPEELLPHIFDLFVQSDRSLDRSQGGLGIGLSVVKQLIEMHEGTVSARSEGPGKGAIFEVRLPVVPAPGAEEAQPAAGAIAPRRVLIVDDNADAANSLALLLELDGHVAESVYGSVEALERTTEFDPEVILLDIGLPGMDGYEVARRIRARGSAARLVALTGYGQYEDKMRANEAGFDSHLVKPVDLHALEKELSASGIRTAGAQPVPG